jgi:hypothetical protein
MKYSNHISEIHVFIISILAIHFSFKSSSLIFRYFQCKPSHGLFAPIDKVKLASLKSVQKRRSSSENVVQVPYNSSNTFRPINDRTFDILDDETTHHDSPSLLELHRICLAKNAKKTQQKSLKANKSALKPRKSARSDTNQNSEAKSSSKQPRESSLVLKKSAAKANRSKSSPLKNNKAAKMSGKFSAEECVAPRGIPIPTRIAAASPVLASTQIPHMSNVQSKINKFNSSDANNNCQKLSIETTATTAVNEGIYFLISSFCD